MKTFSPPKKLGKKRDNLANGDAAHASCYWFSCSVYLLVISCYVRLRYTSVIHFSHTHTAVIAGLLINNSMYMCVSVAFVSFYSMLYDIRSIHLLLINFFLRVYVYFKKAL